MHFFYFLLLGFEIANEKPLWRLSSSIPKTDNNKNEDKSDDSV